MTGSLVAAAAYIIVRPSAQLRYPEGSSSFKVGLFALR